MDNIYHNCQWCHYYKNGKCYNKNLKNINSNSVSSATDEGELSEILEEILSNFSIKNILIPLEEKLISYKISKKRITEVKKLLTELLNQWLVFIVKEDIDIKISEWIQNIEAKTEENNGVIINNPNSFYCNYFI